MVVSHFVAFSCLLLLIGPACAQSQAPISAPNCTDDTFSWSFNSLDQNPCWVAAYLAGVCHGGVFAIPSLNPQNSYTGPNGLDDGDLCKCNTVLYNLISACDACQGDPWTTYSAWSYNCTASAPAGTFPEPIPADTRVPKWAYLNPVPSDNWNASAAQLAGEYPEVTGSASTIATATKAGQTSGTPTSASSSPSSPSSSKSSRNTGAIAGGVVGGAIGAAVIASVVAWFVIRRRRPRSAPSAAFVGSQGSEVAQKTEPYPLSLDLPPKFYDPSDPSTYPPHAPSSVVHTTAPASPYLSSPSLDLTRHAAYTGLPEV